MHKILTLTALAAGLAACAPEVSERPPQIAVAPSPTLSASPASPPRAPQAPAQVFASEAPRLGFADPARRTKLASSFGAVDAMIESEMRRQDLPSITVGIVIDGELAHVLGAGVTDLEKKTRPDADTVYRIGSIGKSFTSLALLSLRDEGALGLDDPLTRWVPEAAGLVYPTRDQPPITLRQLVTHTSGLPGNGAFELGNDATEEAVVKSLAGFALEGPPGTAFHYSNLGFVLTGLVVSRAAHAPLREIVGKRIFTPLGMSSTALEREGVPAARIATGYGPGPGSKPHVPEQWRVGATAGAGGIYSSVRDMARYAALHLSAYPPRDAPEEGPLRRSTLREAHATGFHARLEVGLESAPRPGEPLVHAEAASYGFGWISAETCAFGHVVGHSGGMPGFTADVELLPDHGVGVVALANGQGDPADIARKVLVILARSGGLAKRTAPLPPTIEAAAKKLLAVYNTWDEQGYAAMLSAKRPKIPEEKDEIAGYRALHGACKSFTLVELISPLEARLQMECERGEFEMKINLSAADGGIDGFTGITRHAEIPTTLKKVLDRLVGLVGKWDASVYPRHLAKSGRTLAETAAAFEALRAEHERCTIASATIEGMEVVYALECKRGARLSLRLETSPKDEAIVRRYDFQTGGAGTCPIR
ncbi:MAG: serine hydrolase domain-containing protein [Minicystis sp.]